MPIRIFHAAKTHCDATWAANFGYGPTEYHECTLPAEFHTKWRNEPPANWFPPGPWWMDRHPRFAPGSPERDRVKLCKHHAEEARTVYNDTVYRFRRVTAR